MKIASWLLAIMLLGQVVSAEPTPAATSDWKAKVKVLKVFSAKEGSAAFRAYLVRWKNHEVIAQDILANSAYQVGDVITILVIKVSSSPKARRPYDVLSFHIIPRSNHALQPTADRRVNLLLMISTLKPEAQLALVSGG